MPSNWKTYKLVQIGQVITGKTPSSKNPEDFGEDYAFVTPSDFGDYHKSINVSKRYLSKIGVNRLKKKLLPSNSVIVTCIGSDMGKVAINKVPCITNQQINSIIVDQNSFDVNHIYYSLNNRYDYLRLLAGDGTTMPIINKGRFEGIELSLPPLPEQKAIAEILSAIDDKIENNLAMNKTLEEMAMALYKHWFVDFGPFQEGEFVESELGLIPKGWEVKRLDDILEFKNQGVNTTTEKVKYSEEGTPVIRANNITANHIDTKNIVYVDSKTFSRVRSQCKPLKRDILFTNIGSQLGSASLSYLIFEYVIAWNVMRICVNEDIYSPELLVTFFNDTGKRIEIKNLNSSSTMPFVSGKVLGGLNILVPDKKNLELINIELKKLYRKIEENIIENQTLIQLRDTLLPKLISGEVRLKEFRKELEKVI